MGLKLDRPKKRIWILTLIYRLSKIPFFSNKIKFQFFLNMEWIFERLAHEKSFDIYLPEKHPLRQYSNNYILNFIKETDYVLDLGCHYGHITSSIANKAQYVVGIDYDNIAIENAKKLYSKENLFFVCDEVSNYLTNNSQKFDVLILSHILEHIDNPESLILRCKPFVKYIYIEVPDFDKSYLNQYRSDMKLDLIYTDVDHVSEFDRHEIKELIAKCELQLIEAEYRFGVQRYWCKKKND